MLKNQQKSKPWWRKAGRLGVLLAIKESYLFLKNVFGLGVHPFKTLRGVQREKDRSQQALILGLPGYVLGMGLVGVWLGRRMLGTSVEWGLLAKLSFLGVIGMSLLIGGYLGFWVLRAWKVKYE